MRHVFIPLIGLLVFFVGPVGFAAETLILPNCLLSLDEEAEVPAQEEGVLKEIPVREGQQVARGELLVQLEDSVPKMQYLVAGYKLKVAEKEAADDISIRYAKVAEQVAEIEYLQAEEANRKVKGAVPLAEVRRLLLKHREMKLSIEKAEKELVIAALRVKVSEAELKAAEALLKRYQIVAPLDAVVVELSRHEGEWVQRGEPVMRLMRMDRLRVEGYVNAEEFRVAEIQDRPVTVAVTLARGKKESCPGRIVYVKPSIEAGGEFLVRAEVENRRGGGGEWVLVPGMSAEMTIQLK
ncbi:MAG: HlyD family efflux transporter periplasmic adaptor subunit [Pirellulales bacterium]|nr:HlyD family efflux transporter periplasmic adaptor subunit [Pirellulales bacterium]